MRLKDKVAVITGAASGMGRAMAELFAREGAVVVAGDVHAARLAELSAGLAPGGYTLDTVVGDIGERADAEALVRAAIDRHGRIDVLQVDLYDATARGPVLDSPAFYRACAACLSRHGIVTVNLFGDHPSYRKNIQAMLPAFDAVISLPEVHEGNVVAIGFKNLPALDFADLYERAAVIRDITRLPARSWVNGIKSAVQAGSPEDH
jgi:NAD(P)-dependent dehydrogenase (short-subunit alcohol dehydrogenase family)